MTSPHPFPEKAAGHDGWLLKTRFNVLRFRLGALLMGHEMWAVFAARWIVRERALRAVTKDGRVVLAECEPLADALYKPLPGNWSFTATLNADPAALSHPESTT